MTTSGKALELVSNAPDGVTALRLLKQTYMLRLRELWDRGCRYDQFEDGIDGVLGE